MGLQQIQDTVSRPTAAIPCGLCPAAPCSVCRALPATAAAELGQWASRTTVDAATRLPPVQDDDMRILADGIVRVEIKLDDGRRQITQFRYAGDALPADTTDVGTRRRMVAVTSCTLCRIPNQAFDDVALRHPEVRGSRRALAAAEAEGLARHVAVVGRLTAAERLALFLHEVATRTGRPAADGGVAFQLPMTREDIADHLGLNVETVSRNLTRLKGAGLLRLPKPSSAIVPDMAALDAAAPYVG